MKKSAIARLVKCKPDEAEVRAPDFVAKLKDAQARAAGAAPRPEAKPNDLINELAATSGRDLVKRLAEEEKTASDLLVALDAQAAKIAVREPHWKQLDTLIGYLPELPEAPAITAERNAIHDGRLLLDDPDKVQPLVNRAADSLRTAVNRSFVATKANTIFAPRKSKQHPNGPSLRRKIAPPSCVKFICLHLKPRPSWARLAN
jgi:hypothetical protein